MLLIFANDTYYPQGGAHDLVGRVDGFFEAEFLLETLEKNEEAHAYDLEAGEIVAWWTRELLEGRHYRTGSWTRRDEDPYG